MKIRPIAFLAAFLALAWTDRAAAALITFDFTATVTLVNPALGSFFTVNEILTGSYTFESTTAGIPSGTFAVDYPALSALSVSGANFTVSWTGGSIFVQDSPTGDEYFAFGLTGFTGTDAGIGVLPTASISLLDPTGAMLSSTLLPLTPPTLPSDPRFGIDYHTGPEMHIGILATLTSLTVAPGTAPEPATLALVGIALAGIALTHLRKPA